MVRYIWIGILSLSFCFNFKVFAQKSCYGTIKIKNSKQSFISPQEVSVRDYYYFSIMVKQEYGENSEQYKSLIPDTAKFRAWYGFPFFFQTSSTRKSIKQYARFPMIAISYKQAMFFCLWLENTYAKSNESYIEKYSLPTQIDYEIIFNQAKITKKKALSPLQQKGCKCVLGLTDNVAEYTQDGMVVEGGENSELKFATVENYENPVGFRIKATVVSKK